MGLVTMCSPRRSRLGQAYTTSHTPCPTKRRETRILSWFEGPGVLEKQGSLPHALFSRLRFLAKSVLHSHYRPRIEDRQQRLPASNGHGLCPHKAVSLHFGKRRHLGAWFWNPTREAVAKDPSLVEAVRVPPVRQGFICLALVSIFRILTFCLVLSLGWKRSP